MELVADIQEGWAGSSDQHLLERDSSYRKSSQIIRLTRMTVASVTAM